MMQNLYSEEEFLNEILSIPSVNGVDDERNLAKFIADYLKKCGVNTIIQEIDSKHANVIAVLEGKTKETVIWNGHLDTVPYGDLSEWETDCTRPVKKNGCIYARGASDMKSGLAGMVYALGRMKLRGYVPKYTIYFLGTCDEEKGGLGAKKILEGNYINNASLLLIGEPTGLKPGIAQKGCMWLELSLHGQTSHGACPEEGANALEYGMKILMDLKQKLKSCTHPLLGNATVQVTVMKGGIRANMTPDEGTMLLDIRLLPEMPGAEVLQWIQEIIEKYQSESNQKFRAGILVKNDRRPVEIQPVHPWVKKLEWEIACENEPAGEMGTNYFTDASILLQGQPKLPVLLFGPGIPSQAHKPNEYVELDKYLKYIKILGRLF